MIQNNINELKKRLKKFYILDRCRESINFILILITSFSILVLFILALESFGKFSSPVRTFLFYGLISLLSVNLLLIIFTIVRNSLKVREINYLRIAKTIGKHFDEIKDQLINVLQLKEEGNNFYSSQLIEGEFEKVYTKTKGINFNSIIDFSITIRLLKIAVISIFITFLSILFLPQLNYALYRIINHEKNFSPPPKFYFLISPGNKEITKGDNVIIKIKTAGQSPGEIFISLKFDDETEFFNKKMQPDSTGYFHYEIASVRNSFKYYVFAEDVKSDIYRIKVVNRPIIKDIELTVIPPSYSKLQSTTQQNNGNITALKGSKVKITLKSSQELSKAFIIFDDSISTQMIVNNRIAFSEFLIKKDSQYKIFIYDKNGMENENPITYTIRVIEDEYPEIEIISPEDNIKTKSDKISVITSIKDDYGFTKLNLNYRISASKYRKPTEDYSAIPLNVNKDKKEDEIYYTWDLSSLVLAEGETVSYYLEVFDNDVIGGPKSSRTKIQTIQVPSIDELFAETESTQQNVFDDLSKTLKEAEELKSELQKISNDLKQDKKEISWEEKERIERATDKFNKLIQKAKEVSQKLSEIQNNLLQNNLLSEETLQKYNELQKILDEMTGDELKEAFRKLQEALRSLIRENIQISLDELKANEEYFKQSLERTINLLKRVQIEQKIDELLNRTEELSRKIQEIKNKTEQSNLSNSTKRDELAERQRDVSNDLNKLEEEMKKLDEKMEELKDLPKDQLKQAIDKFNKQNNQQLSELATKKIQQMQKMEALDIQQHLLSNMTSMSNLFKELQSAMQQMNQLKAYYDMMKILDDLLTLSEMQENLRNETFRLGYNSNDYTRNSRKQNELQNNLKKILNKMTDLSQKTFSITPEMGKALGRAYSEMQKSINALQNRNGASASHYQNRAMEYLNESANFVKGAMEQMMRGGQGGGMMSLFQQLQNIIHQQMNLNQLSQMLNQQKITQELMSQLQKLAAEQEMIRKSLEQLNKEAQEAGKSKSLAANLQKVLEEMKEVVTNLETEKLNDELIKKQERILSRLLDAQRSINERDYEKERRSTTGKNVLRTSPPELILSNEERKYKIRDELKKAMMEGYKKDYEDLIRKYFQALQEAENK